MPVFGMSDKVTAGCCKESLIKWYTCGVTKWGNQQYGTGAKHVSKNTDTFVQGAPTLFNTFLKDPFLQRCLQGILPDEVYADISKDLIQFGERIVSEIEYLGRSAEINPPALRVTGPWGDKLNQLQTCQAWKDLHDISAEEGLVAIGYERKHEKWSRLHQFVKLLLFSPSSGLYSCPLAMTDGAAKLIEMSDDVFIKDRTFLHLISRKSDEFWTSGQWMTERRGGSDVGASTKTLAYSTVHKNWFTLWGEKWFSSAADSDMAFTLARIVDDSGNSVEGSKGLSLFYLETKDSDGTYNKIRIQHLKNKLGTRQLPTAELLLEGTLAYLVGPSGSGITNISPMLTISRLHNSISSVAVMRRVMQLCTDYATKRTAFGKYLSEHPLHIQTLSRMEVQTRGCTLLTIEVSQLLGKSECHLTSPEEEVLLRYLVSLAKLYTAKQAVIIASEGLECIGGQGYIEDTGLPGLLRDAQVLPIWEGTTNILSLDVVKVYTKHKLEVISEKVKLNLGKADQFNMVLQANSLLKQLKYVDNVGIQGLNEDISVLHTAARDFATSLAQIYIGSLLVKMASSGNSTACDRDAAVRWCNTSLPLVDFHTYKDSIQDDYRLTMN